MSGYAVNRLVQELFRQPGLLQRFQDRRAEVYAEYGLDATQRAGLDDGTPPALAAAGVHPILQMHYMLANNPDVARLISVNAYRDAAAKEQ
jgi:2'-aminobiphenyl-2,3-diol 1,2-dioxygenase, small subunit